MVGFAERRDDAIAASIGWAQIDEQDLIVSIVDDVRKLRLAMKQIDFGQLALEDAELDMIAPVFHRFENLTQPFGVGDVVADDVRSEHV